MRYVDAPEPELPAPDWVKVRVRYAGICGSDINLVLLHDSPSASPYASFPFTIGHEAVGEIAAVGPSVRDLRPGERVVVDPILACAARGFTNPCPACARGDYSLCERRTEGIISPGLIIGACRDTGGSWSSHFVAHQSQVVRVPDGVDDLDAALVDPFSSALHAIMRNPPRRGDTALVIGAGVIGLCAIAALRALDYGCRVVALAKHGFQADLAARFGADEVIPLKGGAYYDDVARALGGRLLRPIFGRPVVQGGADVVYECVGRDRAIDDALRFARTGGKVVLIGLAAIPRGVDWTPIWMNELEVKGSFACSTEEFRGRRFRTYEVALELMRERRVDLSPLVTHKFPLDRYREAIATAAGKRRAKAIKVLLQP